MNAIFAVAAVRLLNRLVVRYALRHAVLGRAVVRSAVAIGLLAASATPGWANLIGTQVEGGMFFGALTENCFSDEGCDEPGSGSTAIVGDGPEFVWPSFDFHTTADFSGTTLVVAFDPNECCDVAFNSIKFTFQDLAFTGSQLSLQSFQGFQSTGQFSYSLLGSVIEINTLDGLTTEFSPYSLTFGVAAIPEPSTSLLIVIGLLAVTIVSVRGRRRFLRTWR